MSSSTNPVIRGNSLYTIVDGPSWTEAEAKSVRLGGHLITIENQEEHDYIYDSYSPMLSTLQQSNEDSLHIGLTRNADIRIENKAGYYDGWISNSTSEWRPDYWGVGGTGGDPSLEGEYTGLILKPADIGPWIGIWNDYRDLDPRQSKGIAEIPFVRRGDSAYVIVEGPTWEEAEANAVALGGHLVTINDAEENEWLVDQYYGEGKLSELVPHVLIGYTDKVEEGIWEWISGETATYSNWRPGEPDGTENYKSGEEYALFSIYDNYNTDPGQWSDIDNAGGWTNEHSYAIAEIPLAPNNTPIGTPTISGTKMVGGNIYINFSEIADPDNHGNWMPKYEFSWEISSDNGSSWSLLTSADAIDGDSFFTLTSAEVGKEIRGVVSYLDGAGTDEVLATDALILSSTNSQDQDGDGFVDEVTNYQMWTASGGVDLTNPGGRTYSDNTSRLWDLTKAVEVPAGFSILLEGDRKKAGSYRVVSAKENGVLSGASSWMNEFQLFRRGYEEVFKMDFNDNGVIDSI